MEIITYRGWRCARLTRDALELIVTLDVGPRIIRLGFVDGPNEFCEYEEWWGKTGGDEWRNYGGHRLWHAPEVRPRTYAPDNEPVTLHETPEGVVVTQPVEPLTGIQKEIVISFPALENTVRVTHRLRNLGLWAVELAPWALSVMAPGGTAIIPLPERGPHGVNLLPANVLALWKYTDLSDPRWTLGRRFILLRQDPQATTPQKIGALVVDGWAAYARAGHVFVKRFSYDPQATYPDFGVNAEFFTNARMLEVESLGPLVRLSPGAEVSHVETWLLLQDVPELHSEVEVEQQLLPRLADFLKA